MERGEGWGFCWASDAPPQHPAKNLFEFVHPYFVQLPTIIICSLFDFKSVIGCINVYVLLINIQKQMFVIFSFIQLGPFLNDFERFVTIYNGLYRFLTISTIFNNFFKKLGPEPELPDQELAKVDRVTTTYNKDFDVTCQTRLNPFCFIYFSIVVNKIHLPI